MRKMLLSGLFLGLMSASCFAQELQVHTIQKLYERELGENREEVGARDQLYSPQLRAVFQEDARVAELADGMACIDYDVLIQGQDFDAQEIKQSLAISAFSSQQVLVNFNNFQRPVKLIFQMQCDGQACLIDDIIEERGSYKMALMQCLDELKKSLKK